MAPVSTYYSAATKIYLWAAVGYHNMVKTGSYLLPSYSYYCQGRLIQMRSVPGWLVQSLLLLCPILEVRDRNLITDSLLPLGCGMRDGSSKVSRMTYGAIMTSEDPSMRRSQ